MSGLPPGTHEAMGRLRDFLSVNGDKPKVEGTPALIAFGEFVGLDHDDQLEIVRLIEDCGLDPCAPVSGGIYVGVLVGLLSVQEAQTSV